MRGQGDFEAVSLDDKECKSGIIDEILKRNILREAWLEWKTNINRVISC